MISFVPYRDIPDLTGRVILVTGGTSGIGKATVLALAKHNPSHIYFTGRNAHAAATVISEARTSPASKTTFVPIDLASSRDHIREALAEKFTSTRLDLFIANAGIMAPPPGLTEEGWEVQWGTNYMGHAVLLQLLRPTMLRTATAGDADVRFVSVSSYGHTLAPAGGVLFDKLRSADAISGEYARYGQSKLGNILLAKAMATYHPEITSVSVHPGLVNTGLLGETKPSATKFLFQIIPFVKKSASEGAYNTLWGATTDVRNLENGAYYEPVGKKKGASKMVNDEQLAEKLWKWTLEELQELEGL